MYIILYLRMDYIRSEGNGTIGYREEFEEEIYDDSEILEEDSYKHTVVVAIPNSGAEFIGWYNEAGELIASAENCEYAWDDDSEDWDYSTYALNCEGIDETTLIAKFTDDETGPLLGDADDDGELTTSDSLEIMRTALGVGAISESANCDVNADGVVNMADALLVLRIALGIHPAD